MVGVIYSVVSLYHHLISESLNGKRVVLTGASSGIGEQMAYHYAKLGADLMITARRESRLQEVRNYKEASSENCVQFCLLDKPYTMSHQRDHWEPLLVYL